MTDMSDRLKLAREKAGYRTAADAARALSIREPTYLGHENGSRGIRPGPAKKYARKFKVNFEWLLSGSGPMAGCRSELDEMLERLPEEDRREVISFAKAKLTIRGLA